MKSLHNYTK